MELPEKLGAFVKLMLEICGSRFPCNCSVCGAQFLDLRSFILSTSVVGAPHCLCDGDDFFGLFSYHGCACGTTIMLRYTDPKMHCEFFTALREAMLSPGVESDRLLFALQSEIHRQALAR